MSKWIPVKSGKFPKKGKDVQVTYIGYNDHKPYCDGFAHYINGQWYWSESWCDDKEPVKVEITAWKKCKPYIEKEMI